MRWRLAALVLIVAAQATAQTPERVAAEALFEAGREAMARGDHATACAKFEESQRLDPAVGTLLNLAQCKEAIGELATAWQLFRDAAQRLPASDRRRRVAEDRAQKLRPRIPRLVIRLAAAAPPSTRVEHAGVELRSGSFGTPLPVNPGAHELVVRAEGHEPRRYRVELVEAQLLELEVTVGEASVEEPAAPAPSPPPPAAADEPRVDSPASADEEPGSLSHAGQLGAFVRADVDVSAPGAVLAPGISYGVGDRIEIAIAGLIGGHAGLEPGAALLLSSGALKPRLAVGVPVFIVDAAHVGLRPAAGAIWDASRRFGIFAEIGAAWFPSPPEAHTGSAVLVSAGVQTRL